MSMLPLCVASTRYRQAPLRLPAQGGAPSAGRFLLLRPDGPPALFHFAGKLAHGLRRNRASFAACEGSFRYINRRQNLRPRALTLLPQEQRFLYRILGTVKPASRNSLANKCFLVGGQVYFHALKRRSQGKAVSSTASGWYCLSLPGSGRAGLQARVKGFSRIRAQEGRHRKRADVSCLRHSGSLGAALTRASHPNSRKSGANWGPRLKARSTRPFHKRPNCRHCLQVGGGVTAAPQKIPSFSKSFTTTLTTRRLPSSLSSD